MLHVLISSRMHYNDIKERSVATHCTNLPKPYDIIYILYDVFIIIYII